MSSHRLGLLSAFVALGFSNGLEGTDLGGGVITRTPVDDRAKIALDLRDMKTHLESGDANAATNIYRIGSNAQAFDQDYANSLHTMSTEALEGKFNDEPTFLFHTYGLASMQADQADKYYKYADDYVTEALADPANGILGAEAAVALNLWMYSAHELWRGLKDCSRSSEEGVNTAVLGLDATGRGAHSYDAFIAYWIGQEQTPASVNGHSLYALAQIAGGLFGTTSPEAKVNTEIKRLYEIGRAALSFSDHCTFGSDTVEQLWSVTNRIISQMYIPLVQMLIHSMKINATKRVRMYAKAIVPQMSQCRPSVYRRLKEKLLDATYDESMFLQILGDLQSTYDCLGFTCADVGVYRTNQIAQCADFPENYPLAQYSPSSNVHQHAKIDLDILAIKILLEFESDSDKYHPMALFYYMYGKHSAEYRADEDDPYVTRSLQRMALSPSRKDAKPFYDDFERYYKDLDYANTMIMDAFTASGSSFGKKWGDKALAQRAEFITKTIQYQVIYMHVLTEMADALKDCEANDANDNPGRVHSWDEVAAFLIGSLEGPGKGGAEDFGDGQLLWNLANKRCIQFSTVNSDGYSDVNSELEDLLYAGRGELDAYDCTNLRSTVRKIEHLILIPIIQSVIRYAIYNEDLSFSSMSGDLAEGEAFALSILPIVNAYDESSTEVIENNMIWTEGKKPVVDGPQEVANAFYNVLDDFGLECRYIGQPSGLQPCVDKKDGEPNGVSPACTGAYATITAFAAAALAAAA